VVINASQVRLTGKKEQQKTYQRYTGYRAGLKIVKAADMRRTHPDRIVKEAVKGMLPDNQLAKGMFRRLKVYAGAEHPHAAQQPRTVDVK
jgi:large subunit ribosomal protein L13